VPARAIASTGAMPAGGESGSTSRLVSSRLRTRRGWWTASSCATAPPLSLATMSAAATPSLSSSATSIASWASGASDWSALATGFAHASHMARCLRRLLGATPTQLRGR
jgi:hypothetical protein